MKKRSLNTFLLTTSIVTFLMLFTIIFSVLILFIRTILTDYVIDDVEGIHETTFEGVSLVLDEINLFYSRIVLDTDFQALFNESTFERQLEKFNDVIDRVLDENTLYRNILLYHDGVTFQSSQNEIIIDQKFIDQTVDTQSLLTFGSVDTTKDAESIWVGKKLRNIPNVLENSAMFFLLDETVFHQFIEVQEKEYITYLIQDNLQVISHKDKTYIGDILRYSFDVNLYLNDSINVGEMLYTFSTSEDIINRYNAPWILVTEIPSSYIFQELNQLTVYLILIGLFAVALSYGLTSLIANKIKKPVGDMMTHVNHFIKSQDVVNISEGQYFIAEFDSLKKSYDEMIQQIISLLENKTQDEQQKRALELYTLQMQINPHFLYNTLDAIAWIAKMKDQKDIEALVLNLAEFFRISLHKGDKFITIEEELTLIDKYTQIVSIRFPNTFEVVYDVDETLKSKPILKLLIQPLVENALKHGLQYQKNGTLTISIKKNKNQLVIKVIDNGTGFDTNNIQTKEANDAKIKGYGLQNIKDRIKLEYGMKSMLSIQSKVGQGTTAMIIIQDFEPSV